MYIYPEKVLRLVFFLFLHPNQVLLQLGIQVLQTGVRANEKSNTYFHCFNCS